MSHEPMPSDLPRCPHGNEAVVTERERPRRTTWIDSDGACECSTTCDDRSRARRAWLALCAEEGGEA